MLYVVVLCYQKVIAGYLKGSMDIKLGGTRLLGVDDHFSIFVDSDRHKNRRGRESRLLPLRSLVVCLCVTIILYIELRVLDSRLELGVLTEDDAVDVVSGQVAIVFSELHLSIQTKKYDK